MEDRELLAIMAAIILAGMIAGGTPMGVTLAVDRAGDILRTLREPNSEGVVDPNDRG